jgi:hypothetical protein
MRTRSEEGMETILSEGVVPTVLGSPAVCARGGRDPVPGPFGGAGGGFGMVPREHPDPERGGERGGDQYAPVGG